MEHTSSPMLYAQLAESTVFEPSVKQSVWSLYTLLMTSMNSFRKITAEVSDLLEADKVQSTEGKGTDHGGTGGR